MEKWHPIRLLSVAPISPHPNLPTTPSQLRLVGQRTANCIHYGVYMDVYYGVHMGGRTWGAGVSLPTSAFYSHSPSLPPNRCACRLDASRSLCHCSSRSLELHPHGGSPGGSTHKGEAVSLHRARASTSSILNTQNELMLNVIEGKAGRGRREGMHRPRDMGRLWSVASLHTNSMLFDVWHTFTPSECSST